MNKTTHTYVGIILTVLFSTQSIYPIIIGGTIWRKQQADKTFQNVYCLTEFHVSPVQNILIEIGHDSSLVAKKLSPFTIIGSKQKTQLYSALSLLSKNKNLMLVEDLGSDTQNQNMNPNQEIVNKEFLLGVVQGCSSRNIPVKNIECRQNKAAYYLQFALGNNNPIAFSMAFVEGETDETIQEIKNYNSGFFLHLYNIKELAKYKILRKNFMNKMEQIQLYDFREAIYRDHVLVDLKAINNIAMANDKTHIVFAAGAAHTKHAETILPLLGYEKIYKEGYDSNDVMSTVETIDWKSPTCINVLVSLYSKSQTFDLAQFLDITSHTRIQTKALCANQIHSTYIDPDKIFIEMIRVNATRFPFCLFLPLIMKYINRQKILRYNKLI